MFNSFRIIMIDEHISIIIPIFNDSKVIPTLYQRLIKVTERNFTKYEIIFVNDGSNDDSIALLTSIAETNENVIVINLTRNFGQSNAIYSGLENSSGDIIIIMDSDLQDQPEDIPLLIEALNNSDISVAIACWKSRKEPFIRSVFSKLFNSIINKITGIKRIKGMGMFRAMKRTAVNEILKISESTSYITSIFYWSGIKYIPVELTRDKRYTGQSGYSISKMIRLASDIILSYSLFPIRLASVFGALISIISFIAGLYLVYDKFSGTYKLPGWTSIVVLLLFLFGLQFIFLGIIGEYLGRIFLETKQRPRYIIDRIISKKTN